MQIVERSFAQDIAKAYKADRPLEAAALNQVGLRWSRFVVVRTNPSLPAEGAYPIFCPAAGGAEHLSHECLLDISRSLPHFCCLAMTAGMPHTLPRPRWWLSTCFTRGSLTSAVPSLDSALPQVVAEHLFHEGLFNISRSLPDFYSYARHSALPQVVAEHLFHEGLFDIGRLFVREAGVAGGEALQRPYASMHTVLQEVKVLRYPCSVFVMACDSRLLCCSGHMHPCTPCCKRCVHRPVLLTSCALLK